MQTLVLALAAVLVAALAVATLRRGTVVRAKLERWRQLAQECTGGQNSAASIFMILLCRSTDEVEATAQSLVKVFDSSSCPMHISVGLYEVVADLRAQSMVAQRYAELAPASLRLGRSFIDRIRFVKVPSARAMLPDAARGFVLSQAYSGQAFVGTVASGVELLENWDVVLLEARRKSGNPLAFVVSAPSPPPHTPLHSLKSEPRAPSTAENQWSALMSSVGERFAVTTPPSVANGQIEAGFLVAAQSRRGYWPRLSARAYARPDTESPQPSLFWSGELSLGPATAVLRQEHLRSVIGAAAAFGSGSRRTRGLRATDYCTSVNLWTSGWDFVTPCTPCARWSSTRDLAAYDGQVQESVDEAWLEDLGGRARSLDDWRAFSSSCARTGDVFARAALGMSPVHEPREVVAKYGSLSGFAAERDALLMELESQSTY